MKRWLLILLVPLCALSLLGAAEQGSGRSEFVAWAGDANYIAGRTKALTPGGAYRAAEFFRQADGCRLVAIPVQRAGELWAILPALIGEEAFRQAYLFDGAFHPMPASAAAFTFGRIERRFRREIMSNEARLVFGEAACVAE